MAFAICQVGSWERYGFVEREGSASDSIFFGLAMVMAAFNFFQVLSVTYSCQVKGIAFARKMHSTTKFAMTVPSKRVRALQYKVISCYFLGSM